MKNVKAKKYLNYVNNILENKHRLVLTVLGLIIGLFLFVSGRIIVDTYETSFYYEYREFRDDALLLKNYNGFGAEEFSTIKDNVAGSSQITAYGNGILYNSYKDGNYFSESMNIIPVVGHVQNNYIYNKSPSFFADEYIPNVELARLKEGRSWTNEEYSSKEKVVIVEEYLAELYFGKVNVIGEEFKIDSGYKYKIIGVLQNSTETQKAINYYVENNINQKSIEEITELSPKMKIYMPYTTFNDIYRPNEEMSLESIIIRTNNAENYSKAFKDFYSDEDNISVISRADINATIKQNISNLSIIFNAILLFTMLVSGLTIMNTMFFSVKERVFEIGVRRSVGATKKDIFKQFIFESLLYVMIALIISLIIATVIAMIIIIYINFQTPLTIKFDIKLSSLFIIFTVSIVEGIVFGLIPAYYASKTNIIEAIRFV